MIFAAQLWKDNNGRLENKNGDWMYMEETWILSNETLAKGDHRNLDEGLIIRNIRGRVLKANVNSTDILSVVKGKRMHLKLLKQFCTVEISCGIP